MVSRKKENTNLLYEGKALYLGPDDVELGLMHAECYDICAKELKSGRVRVDLDTCGTKARVPHLTFKSKDEYKFLFIKKKALKGMARGKEE